MKRCPYCGVEYPDSEVFCPADQETLVDLSAQTREAGQDSSRKSQKRHHAGGVVCILFGALLLFAALFTFHNTKDNAARIVLMISALIGVLLVAAGIYLNLEKADREY